MKRNQYVHGNLLEKKSKTDKDLKFIQSGGFCMECTVDKEHEIRTAGLWEEYQNYKIWTKMIVYGKTKLESYKNGFITYSLGNFIFPLMKGWSTGEESMILSIGLINNIRKILLYKLQKWIKKGKIKKKQIVKDLDDLLEISRRMTQSKTSRDEVIGWIMGKK